MMTIDTAKLKAAAEQAKDDFRPNVVVSTRDVLELIAALEAAQKRVAELENDEVRQRLANAEHQIYMAELAKNNLRASRKAQFKKRKAAEARIAELEARTVKLPPCVDDLHGVGMVMSADAVTEALSEAGINLETGGE